MNLSMHSAEASGHPQNVRGVAETWGEHNLYCPNCPSPRLTRPAQNSAPGDFSCPDCGFQFQLKGQKMRFSSDIADGIYATTLRAVKNNDAPAFFFVHYDLPTWTVRDVLLVPGFAIPPSAITKRKSGASCNITLSRIPLDARIPIVTTIKASRSGDTECIMISRMEEVRAKFKRLTPLADIASGQRALALDVLNIIRRLKKTEFTSADFYPFERELKKLHAGQRNLRDKIRRQLQVLRNAGFLIQPARGQRGLWQLK
jgi:type II restriction enzyme